MTSILKWDASPIQIYITHPSGADVPWRVSEDGEEGESYRAADAAVQAAYERARALEEMGFDVQVRQENSDGTWLLLRE